jgi:hypothetical protein
MKTKQQILEEKRLINESIFSLENILMVAGFVPVIGEIADVALILYYLKKGQYLYAALMLVALIPTFGDILVKPFIKSLQGVSKLALKNGDELINVLNKNPKLTEKFKDIVSKSKDVNVTKTIDSVSKINKGWGQKLKDGIDSLTSIFTKVKPIAAIKKGVDTAIAGGKFSAGLKGYYQGERLSKFLAKRGVEPSGFIQKWWIKFGARQDRKSSFKNFIMSNNLLQTFGLPSLSSLENKIENDEEFREKMADNEQMSNFIAQNSDETYLKPEEEKKSTKSPDFLSGLLNVSVLKKLAGLYA